MSGANVKATFYRSSLNGVEKDFVSISITGSKDQFVGPVRPTDLERFPEAWAAYKEGKKVEKVGTPLTKLPGIDEARIRELTVKEIETVEELADLTDGATFNMGPIFVEFKKIATLYLEANGRADKLVVAEPVKKRGRPRKVIENDPADDLPEHG